MGLGFNPTRVVTGQPQVEPKPRVFHQVGSTRVELILKSGWRGLYMASPIIWKEKDLHNHNKNSAIVVEESIIQKKEELNYNHLNDNNKEVTFRINPLYP